MVAQVIGNDATVAFAGSQGHFELNTYMPVMARNLLESMRLLASVSRLLRDRCVDGIEADVERCRAYAEASLSIVTSLAPLRRLRAGGRAREGGGRAPAARCASWSWRDAGCSTRPSSTRRST